ncbi:MAG: TonB-dependent receptor [Gemmatimonadota bacterium]
MTVRPVTAQTGTLVGRVHTAEGRGVPAALILAGRGADTATVRAAETDDLGRFRMADLAPGEWTLRIRRIGYDDADTSATVTAGGTVTVEFVLRESAISLPGVAVEVDRQRASFREQAGATTRHITREEMKRVPGVAEADVLRAIELLPGVVSTSDYSSAFNVRGGSADENLILLDGFPIYNPFHLGGFFSVFNADMVARAELLAGGFPAEYGGRVSSVLNVESDASGIGTSFDAGVSLLATRLAVGGEIPAGPAAALGLGTARFRLSARRSYFDQLFRPFFDFPYHLTDLQAFFEGWTRSGARVTLTAYHGRDVLDLAATDSFPLQVFWQWGNDVVGLRAMQPLAQGMTLDGRIGYTRFSTGLEFPDFGDTDFRSRIDQWTAHLDVEKRGALGTLKVGLDANRFEYANQATTGGTDFRRSGDAGWLTSAFLQTVIEPGPWLIELGARLDTWSAGSPGRGGTISTASPRVAVKRFLGRDAALKIAAGRYTQYLHSLRDEELPLGLDIWVLSGPRAPEIVSNQLQGGVEVFFGAGWFASLEAYVRDLDGVATNNFADDPNDPFDDLIGGTGHSLGTDLFIRRDRGRWQPALAVSWLRARRSFADPTLGIVPAPIVEYPPIFDRRLDIELTLNTTLPRGIEAGLRWNYGSGLPYTKPVGGYTLFRQEAVNQGRRAFPLPEDSAQLGVVLGPRNGERYPAYHRLDVSFRRAYRKRWGTLTPYLDILNIYNRKNPLFYFYQFERTPPTRSGISMFPLLPTIGVEARF